MRIIAIIPARGGSKGIPRKNLRPLAGKPLIYYSINACLTAESVSRVVVTTDDEEIALLATRFGAEVVMRPPSLADDTTTLDPVISHAVNTVGIGDGPPYDIVLTVQPTSPLITAFDIDRAMRIFEECACDTVMSVVDDRHLCWTLKDNKAVPEYQQRVNRQSLPPRFKETGAIIACRREILETGTRIGENIALYEVRHEKSFDIDSISDFYLCESLLGRKTIVLHVCGNSSTGLGHVYRAVMLANDLVRNEIVFVVTDKDDLAAKHIDWHNYQLHCVPEEGVLETIRAISPELVVNDVLDTSEEFMSSLKEAGFKVVNFEDMGPGIEHADLVINALYPPAAKRDNVLSGPDYFCLRDEFLHIHLPQPRDSVSEVLLCFGGVDEGNLTCRSLAGIAEVCREQGIRVTVVLGLGYSANEELDLLVKSLTDLKLEIVRSTARISDFMVRSDLAFTSGGRTVFELAALHVPTIVICQNDRELTHEFASEENGVINLGHRDQLDDLSIRAAFEGLLNDREKRKDMREKAKSLQLGRGKRRVVELIENLLEARSV